MIPRDFPLNQTDAVRGGLAPYTGVSSAQQLRTVVVHAAEFVLVSVAVLVAPLMVYLDILYFGGDIGDRTLTEITQSLLLVAAVVMFALRARALPAQRGFLVLVAGFFLCMLIREQDGWLDNVRHGFWLPLALAVAVLAIGYAARYARHSVLPPMARFIGSHGYYYVFFGLVILLVFSRVFGSGNLLWESLMAESYEGRFKNAIQEGLELLGYILIFLGAVSFFRSNRPAQR